MRVVVTGAAGFIGSHVVEALADTGHEPVGFVRPSDPDCLSPAVQKFVGELRDQASLRRAFGRADAVVHCAALVDPYANPWDARAVNWIGAFNVCHAAADSAVSHLIHMSSIAAWQRSSLRGTLTESDLVYITEPPVFDTYSPNKAAAERTVTDFARTGRLAATILRPGAVYGRRDHISRALVSALRRSRFVIPGSGQSRFPLLHVDDLAAAVVAALAHPPAGVRDYNLSGPDDITLRHFVEAWLAELQLSSLPPSVPYGLAHRAAWAFETWWSIRKEETPPPFNRFLVELLGRDVIFDTARARDELGWTPRLSLLDGVRDTALWVDEQPPAAGFGSVCPV